FHGLYFPKQIEDISLSPLFLERKKWEEIRNVSEKVIRLFEKIFNYLEGLKPGYLLSTSGLHPDAYRFFTKNSKEKRDIGRIARPDILLYNGNPFVIELNVGSSLGGILDIHEIAQFFANSPMARELEKSIPIWTNSPMVSMAQFLKSYAKENGLPDPPRVGILEWDFGVEINYRYAATLTSLGVPSAFMNPDLCSFKNGKLYFQNLPIDIGIKHFHISDLDFPEDTPFIESLFQGTENFGTSLLAHEDSTLMSDKRLMGYLYEYQEILSSFEKEFLFKHIPWTCVLEKETVVSYRGEKWKIEKLLDPRFRSEFLMKPGPGLQGKGIVVGKDCTPSVWEREAQIALDTGRFILQKFYKADTQSLPFLKAGKLQYLECPIILGPFVIDYKADGGIFVRYTKDRGETIINYHRGSHTTCCFIEN
ncbi:MAG: hypothetical protein ACREPR_02165, partial [Brasilonema sp.]